MDTAFFGAFNWYGFLMATGILLGVVAAYITARKRGIDGDVIFTVLLIALPLAILGARCYHVFFDVLAGNKWTFTKFIGLDDGGLAGLAIYGALFGTMIALGIYHAWSHRKKNPPENRVTFFQLADIAFTFMLIGQAIGRWGNYTNEEAYGYVVTNPTWQWFPFAVFIEKDNQWHYAMFFYESLWNFIGFCVIFYFYIGRHKSFDGFNFACYCIYYGTGRSWIEAIRDDGDVLMLGSMRVSLLVSLLFVVAGIAIIATHIALAKKSGKKIFILVDKDKLDDSYYGYENTKIAHPMPGALEPIFGKKKKDEDYYVDDNGVVVKTDGDRDNAAVPKEDKKSRAKVSSSKETEPSDEYKDEWDD